MAATAVSPPRVGPLLRGWRRRRRRSQLDLALATGVSSRHLSYVETGRSRPSAELLLRLAAELDVPLREQDALLLAAGHAPAHGARALEEPAMGPVRAALDAVLAAHEPFPALVVDRHWGLVAANAAVAVLTEGAAPWLLEPPVNVLRLSLHPEGVAERIVDLPAWREHVLERLGRQAAASGDPALAALREELEALPVPEAGAPVEVDHDAGDVAVPLRLRCADGTVLALLSTVTTFGTPVDATVAELSIEAFLPADAATAAALRARQVA